MIPANVTYDMMLLLTTLLICAYLFDINVYI